MWHQLATYDQAFDADLASGKAIMLLTIMLA